MSNHLTLLFTADFYSLPHTLQQKVYHDYYRLVYPLVFFILKDHGATEDIIQESFMRSIQKSAQLQDLEKLESWLKTLARNVTLNSLRKFSRSRDELESEDVFPNGEVSCAGHSISVMEEVEVKMMREALSAYLDQLKPEYRQIIEMRWIHNLSYKEMAAIMNVSEGIIRQKLFRAREAVKKRFQMEWGIR
jgi:RNA polymerase sigma-70 factor (ECF subfamily)